MECTCEDKLNIPTLLGFTLGRTFDLPGHLTAWADLAWAISTALEAKLYKLAVGGAVVIALLFIVLNLL